MSEDLTGVAPPDFDTDIGQLRALIPDVSWEPLTPPVTDRGAYLLFGDALLQVYLDRAGGDVDRAVIYAWTAIADKLILEAGTVQSDDLRLSNEKRAELYYRKVQDANAALNADIFVMANIGPDCSRPPELSEWPVCGCVGRCYC